MKNIFSTIILAMLSLILLTSCGSSDGSKGEILSKEEKWEKRTEDINVTILPSISFEEMKVIYEGSDFIDFIFYNVEFSMSVNRKTNIQKMVGFISTNVAHINPKCQAMGRVFFQQNGALLMEADMFYDKECQYFLIYKDGKLAYANKITPEGQAYFQQIFSKVKVEPN